MEPLEAGDLESVTPASETEDSGLYLQDDDDTRTLLYRPLWRVKLTGYRFLNIGVVIVFGSGKAALTYHGLSTAPTTLDWVLGVVLTIGLYWLGLYESADPPLWPSFFHKDYSHILSPVLRFVLVFCFSVVLITFGLLLLAAAVGIPAFLTYIIVANITTQHIVGAFVAWIVCCVIVWHGVGRAEMPFTSAVKYVLRLCRIYEPIRRVLSILTGPFSRFLDRLPPSPVFDVLTGLIGCGFGGWLTATYLFPVIFIPLFRPLFELTSTRLDNYHQWIQQ